MAKRLRFWLHRLRQERLLHGLALTAALGLLLVNFPPLLNLSYDLSFLAPRSSPALTNLVLVYANEDTLGSLGDGQGSIARTNHARLLDRLAKDGAGIVLYDFAFTVSNQVAAVDETLAQSIRREGSVVLVALEDSAFDEVSAVHALHGPIQPLRQAAKDWGHAELFGRVVRTISGDWNRYPYAVWTAATNSQPEKFAGKNRNLTRWLNYYAAKPLAILPYCYFHDVLTTNRAPPPGFFAHQIVFVGQKLASDRLGRARDVFATPFSWWTGSDTPGVAIHATAFLNLLRDDWLRLVPRVWQCLLAGIWGTGITALFFAVSRTPRLTKLLVTLGATALVCAVSLYVQWHYYWWWAWVVPAFFQPLAAWAWVARHPKPNPYYAFISYRTEEDGSTARVIADALASRGCRTFLDVKALEAGPFDEQLLEAIDRATAFVLVLSPNSLARCAEPDDWVLRELSHALGKVKRIIPVFKDGFDFDDRQVVPDLPELRKLRAWQGVKFSLSDFDGFMAKLRKLLEVR